MENGLERTAFKNQEMNLMMKIILKEMNHFLQILKNQLKQKL